MKDFLIVGNGLAANILALQFKNHNISYKILGNASLSSCSRIAAGMWNPVVFKRMTKSWMADELIPSLKEFYNYWQKKTKQIFYHEREIIKPFFSEEEKNFWQKKAEGDLRAYITMPEKPEKNKTGKLIIPREFGKVKHSGNIDTLVFLSACEEIHREADAFSDEIFDSSLLQISPEHIRYKNVTFKNIIFCEGYMVKQNPYFNFLPMLPVKGEVLEIQSSEINIGKNIFNRNGFLLPVQENVFKCGSTYNWNELNDLSTENGKKIIIEKIKNMTSAPFSLINHQAGVRPSVKDRRPIIGKHPKHQNAFIFNGLGTKGVMLAPYLSKKFVNYHLGKEQLPGEVSIERFYNCYENKQ